jgi:RNA polymerase sigma-70 factor (ECF subfamily)
MARLRDPAAAKAWLATVAVRVAGRKLRRRRLRALLRIEERGGHATRYEDLAAPGASPEERALLARVYAVLDAMPVPLRLAWTLRHVEGERLEAVAALTGCSLATAKRRIAAAQEILERELGDARR